MNEELDGDASQPITETLSAETTESSLIWTPQTIALSILEPRAKFAFLIFSKSAIKPKVRARDTSREYEDVEKLIESD